MVQYGNAARLRYLECIAPHRIAPIPTWSRKFAMKSSKGWSLEGPIATSPFPPGAAAAAPPPPMLPLPAAPASTPTALDFLEPGVLPESVSAEPATGVCCWKGATPAEEAAAAAAASRLLPVLLLLPCKRGELVGVKKGGGRRQVLESKLGRVGVPPSRVCGYSRQT